VQAFGGDSRIARPDLFLQSLSQKICLHEKRPSVDVYRVKHGILGNFPQASPKVRRGRLDGDVL
jgi:hypothetical protein